VPEIVKIAGGIDELGREGSDSVRIPWDDFRRWDPEIQFLMPCGFHIVQVVEQAPKLCEYEGWSDLTAVRNSRVYAVDANSYFARPGSRVIDGAELLAHRLHPDISPWNGPGTAFSRVGLTDYEVLESSPGLNR
jgi:iron complex transport system substrate-binding protein